jgi:cytochrome c oxidase subunit 2
MLPQLSNLLAQEIPIPDSSINHKGDFWFPEQASTFAPEIDNLYYAIFWLSTIFFALIVGFMIYFSWKYRRVGGLKGEIKPEKSTSHNTALEIFWSVIPSVILIWIFWEGASGYFEMRVPTDDCEVINVKAQKWNWSFTYPNGDQTTELHLVRDKPVKLVLESPDVLHSFYVAAFRQKMDIVPGRYTYAYVNPNKAGTFRLACTEYCGDGHSRMRTNCVVHKTEAARKADTQWLRPEHPPWENGERLYKMHCSGCHRIDGLAATGPALNLIWDKDEELADGSTRKVDENYVTESILYPGNDIVKGYTNQMQAFAGKLDEETDIPDLIAYLKYLKDPEAFKDDPSVMKAEAESDGKEVIEGNAPETAAPEDTPDDAGEGQ